MTTLSHFETITHRYGMLPDEVFGYEPRATELHGHPLPTKAVISFDGDRSGARAVYAHELDDEGRLLRVTQDGRLLFERTWHTNDTFTETLPNQLTRTLERVEDNEWLLTYARGDAARISSIVDPDDPETSLVFCEHQDYDGSPGRLYATRKSQGRQAWEGVYASAAAWRVNGHPISQTHFDYVDDVLERTITVGTDNMAGSCIVRFERVAGQIISVISEAVPNWRSRPLVQQKREYDTSGRVENIQTKQMDSDGEAVTQYVELSYH